MSTSPDPSSPPRPRRRRLRRWTIRLAALAGLLLLLGTIALHLAVVRARVLSAAAGWVSGRYGMVLKARSLDYNVWTLRATLHDMSLAAVGSMDRPFLRAERIDADVAWSSVWGPLHITSVKLRGPQVVIAADAADRYNLPSTRFKSKPGGRGIHIDHVQIDDLSFTVEDPNHSLHVDGSRCSIVLTGRDDGAFDGRVDVGRPGALQVGAWRTSLERLGGPLTLDRSGIELRGFALATSETDNNLTGHLPWSGTGSMDLGLTTRANAGQLLQGFELGRWADGIVTATGHVSGQWSNPQASLHATSDALSILDVFPAAPMVADVVVNRRTLHVTSTRTSADWGQLAAVGDIVFGATVPSRVRVQWTNLDAETVARAGYIPIEGWSTRLNGTATLTWRRPVLPTLAITAHTELRPRPGPGVALSGTASYELAHGHWTAPHRLAADGGSTIQGAATGDFGFAGSAQSVLGGQTTIASDSLLALARLAHKLGLPTIEPVTSRLSGAVQANVVLSGPLKRPTAAVTFQMPGAQVRGVGAARVEGAATVSANAQLLDTVSLTGPGLVLTAERVGRHQNGTLQGTFDVRAASANTLIAALVPGWEWLARGPLTATGTLEGTTARWRIGGRFAGHDVSLGGQHADRLEGAYEVDSDAIRVRDVRAQRDGGSMVATGGYLFERGGYSVDTTFDAFPVQPCPSVSTPTCPAAVPVSGVLSGRVTGEGLIERPTVDARLSLTDAKWNTSALGRVDLTAHVNDGAGRVAASAPALGLQADVDASMNAISSVTATVQATGTNVADALDRFGLSDLARRVSGTITGRARFEGDPKDPWSGTVVLHLDPTTVIAARPGTGQAGSVPIALSAPVDAQLSRTRIAVSSLAAQAAGISLTGGGTLGSPGSQLTLSARGDAGDVVTLARSLGADIVKAASGPLAIDVVATGSPEHPALDVRTTFAHGTVDVPAASVSGVELDARLHGGRVELTRLAAESHGASVDVSGAAPLRWLFSWDDKSNAANLDQTVIGRVVGWLTPPQPAGSVARLDGNISADLGRLLAERVPRGTTTTGSFATAVHLTADAPGTAAVSGRLTVSRAALSVGAASVEQVAPADITITRGLARVAPWQLKGAGTEARLAGTATLSAERNALDLNVSGRVALAPFQPLLGFPMAGAVQTNLHLGGAWMAPRVDGTLQIEDAAVRMTTPRVAVGDINGLITFTGGRAYIDDVTATANGGPVLIRGTYDLTGTRVPDVSITAAGVPIELVAGGPRAEVDIDLHYASRNGTPVISGRAELTPLPFRGSALALYRLFETIQEQYGGGPAGGGGGRRRAAAGTTPTNLDIAVVTKEPLGILSNIGQVELTADLTIKGTLTSPAVLGDVTLGPDGLLRAGGRTYRIQRGTITFANPRQVQPVLDVTAVSRISSYDVTMTVTGPTDALRTSLRSDPPLSETDLRSLIVTGRLASDPTRRGGELVDEQRVVESLSSDLFGFAARTVGLDAVSIGVPDLELIAGGIDASTSLNVSKVINRQMEVVFSQDLQNDNFSWLVIIRPFRTTSFRILSRENQEGAIEVRQELTFGGPARRPASRPAAAESERIGSITFSGALGFDRATLADELGLNQGDQFDPWRWQARNERLRSFYAQHGFRQVRLRPTRSRHGGVVDLEYNITRGPRCSLTIRGYQFSKSVIAGFDDAWQDALTPAFLVDDLRSLARRRLIDDGYLTPEVGIDITTNTPDVLDVLMTVTPGLRVSRRSITFEGNTHATAEQLQAAIDAAGVSASGWYAPDTLERPVTAYYRQQGFLDVQAEAGPVSIADGRGVLPVHITEGPRYRIASVKLEGVKAYPASKIRDLLQLQEGEWLEFARVRQARDRVQAFYLQEGFTDSVVRIQPNIDREAKTVSPRLVVSEGTRRIVRNIRVTGNVFTRSKTISDYAQVHGNTPVSPTFVPDLQKRLYDTGAFSSVSVEFVPATPADPGPPPERDTLVSTPADKPVIAVIKVEEAPPYSLRYGVQMTRSLQATGTDTRYAPGAGADFRNRNLFGRAITAGFGVRYDVRDRSVQTLIGTQRTYGKAIRTNLYFTADHENDDRLSVIGESDQFRLDDDTVNVTAEQRARVRSKLELAWALNYTYRRVQLFERKTSLEVLDFAGNTAGPRVALLWDSRDNPFDATKGWFHSSALDLGFTAVGSDVTYLRYLLQEFHYVPVKRLVLASGFRFGTIHTFSPDKPIVLDLRFRVGGSRTVRGYREDSLGPLDLVIPFGGNELLVMNQEVRFPIWKWFKGVGFVDVGNAFPSLDQIRLNELKVGTGVGLRLATPVGLFRVDLGFPVNGEPTDAPRWYFSIGQAF